MGRGFWKRKSLNNYIVKLWRYLSEDDSLELATIQKVGYKLIYRSK